jgi:hypothetical protein
MTSKTDFTEDEWKAMQKGVTGVGMLVSVSDRDFTDTFGEVGALARYLEEQREQSQSELIRELSEPRKSGFGLTSSPQEVETETLEALRAATAALTSKAPNELDAYRQLVLGVADRVANAKGGGMSPSEAEAIEKVRQAVAAA